MKRDSIAQLFTILAMVLFLAGYGMAQFPSSLPKIPKIRKTEPKPTPSRDEPKSAEPEPSASTSNESTTPTPTASRDECSSDWWVKTMAEDIAETRKEAEEFKPGSRDYYVSTLSDRQNKFLEAALSKTRRQNWFKDANLDAVKTRCMNKLLDDLAGVAHKTLPGYTGPAGYTLGTAAEKKLLLGTINDIAGAKVLKVGLKQPTWLIDKNNYGLPTARYKHGVIWAQYPDNDTGYCWIFWVNLVQDYAGGGTYGASYGNYISRAVAGCPAAK